VGRDTFHYTRLLRVPSNLDLNTSKDETSTTSLGNLIQCLQRINCTTQLGGICKLAEGALNLTVYVINRDIE